MSVALSRQKLKQWIGNAIEGFRSNDLLGVPDTWLKIYESLAAYISSGQAIDQKLFWMIEATDDELSDIVYQLQRLKSAMVKEILTENALEELGSVLTWFDKTVISLIERATGRISEERSLSAPYETVFWKARDGMYISTVEGRFLHCNQALMDMLKCDSLKNLLTMDIGSDLYVNQEQRQIMLDHLLTDGFFDHHEFEFRCRNGEIKNAIESCYLVDAPNGKQFIVGIMVDVTREKEMERNTSHYIQNMETKRMEAHFSLRQVAKRFDALKRVNSLPFAMVDAKTFRILNYNPQLSRRFKYSKKHIARLTLRNLFGKDDWMDIFTRLSNLDKSLIHFNNVRCVTRDGQAFQAGLHVVSHQDDMGAAFFIQIEDKTAVFELDAALTRVRENQKQIINKAPFGIIGFREDGTVALVNPFFVKRMGYSGGRLKSPSFIHSLFSDDEYRLKFNKYIRRFLRGRHADNVAVELTAKSGVKRNFLLKTMSYQFDDAKKPGFLALLTEKPLVLTAPSDEEAVAMMREHQETRDRYEKLQDVYNDLRQMAMLRRGFLKVLAKKFKVPIHVVLGFASLLKKDLNDVISEGQREDIDIIQGHIALVLNMLEKALEYAPLEDDEVEYLPKKQGVRAMLDDLFERLTPSHLPPKVSFSAKHQILSIDLKISTDKHLLESLLRHLLDNAFEFTESGSVWLTAFKQDGFLCIEISDTGAGIEPAALPLIFEPFFQSNQTEHEKKGLGLGLAIAKKYLDLVKGEIEIDTHLKKGTKILVKLPGLSGD